MEINYSSEYEKQRKERLYDALFDYFDHDDTQTLLDDFKGFIDEQTKHYSDKILELADFSHRFKL